MNQIFFKMALTETFCTVNVRYCHANIIFSTFTQHLQHKTVIKKEMITVAMMLKLCNESCIVG